MSTNINLKNSTDTTFSITHSDGANTKVLDSKDIAVAIDTDARWKHSDIHLLMAIEQ